MRDSSPGKILAEIVGENNFFQSPADLAACTQTPDFSGMAFRGEKPLAAVRPVHKGQLEEILRFCGLEGIPIAVRGSGTSIYYPNLRDRPLLVLTSGLNRILDLDIVDRTIRVECGVKLAKIKAMVEEKGLFYPPDPGSAKQCTIGGNIALNAAGANELKYGPTCNYAREVELLTASGESMICHIQKGMPGKIACGYPLASSICGSAGTLGIIYSAALKLLPKPQCRQFCAAIFKFEQDAATAVMEIMASGINPAKMEFLDKLCASMQNPQWQGSLLFLEFDGHPQLVAEEMAKTGQILRKFELLNLMEMDKERGEAFLATTSSILPVLAGKIGHFLPERICAPVSRLDSLLEGINEIGESTKAPMAVFGHAGIARINAAIFLGDNPEAAREAARNLFTLELVLNNCLQSEREVGVSRESWQCENGAMAKYSGQIRHIFDPAGLLSPQSLPDDPGCGC